MLQRSIKWPRPARTAAQRFPANIPSNLTASHGPIAESMRPSIRRVVRDARRSASLIRVGVHSDFGSLSLKAQVRLNKAFLRFG